MSWSTTAIKYLIVIRSCLVLAINCPIKTASQNHVLSPMIWFVIIGAPIMECKIIMFNGCLMIYDHMGTLRVVLNNDFLIRYSAIDHCDKGQSWSMTVSRWSIVVVYFQRRWLAKDEFSFCDTARHPRLMIYLATWWSSYWMQVVNVILDWE